MSALWRVCGYITVTTVDEQIEQTLRVCEWHE